MCAHAFIIKQVEKKSLFEWREMMKLWIQHLLFNYNYELYLPKKEEINAKKILTKVWREKKK